MNERFWRSPAGIIFVLFAAVGGYFLWVEHRAHVIDALPYLLLFVCVGMHFFMHGGHGGHKHDKKENDDER